MMVLEEAEGICVLVLLMFSDVKLVWLNTTAM